MPSVSWTFRAFFGASVSAVALAWSLSAAAQTTGGESVALNSQSTPLHYNQDGSASSHPNGSQPTWISHDDCERNVYIKVALTLTGSPLNAPVQVWAAQNGADCTQVANISGPQQVCWPVTAPQQPATSMSFNINAQDIVQYITAATGSKPTSYTPGNASGCDSFSQSGPVPVTLYFIPFVNGQPQAGSTPASYAVSVALIGPAAPSNVIVGAGDTLIKVDWTPASDANTQGFAVFCDPPPGKEGQATDASATSELDSSTVLVCDSTTEDGGFDDAGNYLGDITIDGGCHYENQSTSPSTSSGNCQSSEIFSGGGTVSSTDGEGGAVVTGATPPPANINDYACGNVGSPTSTEALVSGLKNGQKYVVGVAAYDVVGNVGPMSIPGCDSPTPVDDFWKDYKAAGGGAGGGFCSVDKKSEPASLSAFALVGAASVVSIVRRRRQNKKMRSARK